MGLAAVMALGHPIGRGKDISGLGDFPIEDRVGQPDATAFLPEIEQNTAPRPAKVARSRLELLPAVATDRAKRVAGQAFGMQADDGRLSVRHTIADQLIQPDIGMHSIDEVNPTAGSPRKKETPKDNLGGKRKAVFGGYAG
jgi:hypothetical protein